MKLKIPCIHILVTAATLIAMSNAAAFGRKPNIVFILADDMGYGDLSCFGSEIIHTPSIDSLAEQGMKFTSFYVHNRCTPTRAALMTGSKASRVGLGSVVYWHDRKGLNPEEITVAELLKKAGYATGLIGKWHLGEWPQFNPRNHGFDYFYGRFSDENGSESLFDNFQKVGEWSTKDDRYCTKKILPAALEFIRKHKDQPFFLYYASQIPHSKWIPHADFKGTSKQGAYGDCVQQLDWVVGELLKELESQGLTKKTLVIFASDNGPQLNIDGCGSAGVLRDGKWTNFEGGIRVPCVMKWPGVIPADSFNNEITGIIDMLPTFCALAGVDVPSDRVIDGRNIFPYMQGKKVDPPIHDMSIVPGATIRYKDWKLLIKEQKPGGSDKNQGRTDRIPAKAGSLFNLRDDIGETMDVSAKHPEKVQQLTKMAEAYLQEFQLNIRKPGYIKGFDAESAEKLKQEHKKNKKLNKSKQ